MLGSVVPVNLWLHRQYGLSQIGDSETGACSTVSLIGGECCKRKKKFKEAGEKILVGLDS